MSKKIKNKKGELVDIFDYNNNPKLGNYYISEKGEMRASILAGVIRHCNYLQRGGHLPSNFKCTPAGNKPTITNHSYISKKNHSKCASSGYIKYIEREEACEHIESNIGDTRDERVKFFTDMERNRLNGGEKGNAQIQGRIMVSLPHELELDDYKEIVETIAVDEFKMECIPFLIAIHRPSKKGDDRNWHLHIVYHPRAVLTEQLFLLSPDDFLYDENGNVIKSKRMKTHFYSKKFINYFRKKLSGLFNKYLEKNGKSTRYTHKSYIDENINKIAGKPLNASEMWLERKGIPTLKAIHNLSCNILYNNDVDINNPEEIENFKKLFLRKKIYSYLRSSIERAKMVLNFCKNWIKSNKLNEKTKKILEECQKTLEDYVLKTKKQLHPIIALSAKTEDYKDYLLDFAGVKDDVYFDVGMRKYATINEDIFNNELLDKDKVNIEYVQQMLKDDVDYLYPATTDEMKDCYAGGAECEPNTGMFYAPNKDVLNKLKSYTTKEQKESLYDMLHKKSENLNKVMFKKATKTKTVKRKKTEQQKSVAKSKSRGM